MRWRLSLVLLLALGGYATYYDEKWTDATGRDIVTGITLRGWETGRIVVSKAMKTMCLRSLLRPSRA
jgi:hypothetical protein